MRPRVSHVWGGERVLLSGGMSCVWVFAAYMLYPAARRGRVLTIKIYLKICGRPSNLLIKICGGPDRNLWFGQRRPLTLGRLPVFFLSPVYLEHLST